MKIVILSLFSRRGGTTGDCVQADKTVQALKECGADAVHYYLDGTEILDGSGANCGSWEQALGDCDIVHTIPPIPWKFIKGQAHIAAKFVTSTIFWRTWTYVRTVHKITGKLTISILKDYLRVFFAKVGMPTFRSYIGYDLLLPNSEDEIRNFLSYCQVKKGAQICAIPNAIDPIPEWVSTLQRPKEVPIGDYIVVPAVFAARKNHLTLIKALQDSSYTVVFMGDGECLEECEKNANRTMLFLGYVNHGSELFYSLLKYARVVCLPSNCETPGIAGLEAAALGARPVVPYEGGTAQYYGWVAEYFDPMDKVSMRRAVDNAWNRGRLQVDEAYHFCEITWRDVAQKTLEAYTRVFR